MHLVTISNDEVPQALKDALKQDYPNLSSATGSILSEGNWWIIVVAAVVVIGGVTAIIIVKKKTALTGGEDDTNER